MYYREQLQAMKTTLSDLLDDLNREIAGFPDGSLYVYEKKGKRYYCQRLPKGGNRKKEHRITINNDPDMILALVRKRYVETAVNHIENDLKSLDAAIDAYLPVSEEMLMEPLCSKYPELKDGLYYGKISQEEWEKIPTVSDTLYPEDLKSTSADGTKIRSGAEMYIVSRLEHFGIPYRYEPDINVPDLRYAPDFIILRPRDRKVIYWEHFGMVNDMEYVKKNIVKVSDYIDYGIRPWDNFIMTFNNEKGGYDGKLIDAMIECWLL